MQRKHKMILLFIVFGFLLLIGGWFFLRSHDRVEQVAVIHVEGSQITLYNESAASGARYAWPSDGAGYVWWTKGPEATLYWKEGGGEAPLLTCAEAQ